jgi:hypothetical protein
LNTKAIIDTQLDIESLEEGIKRLNALKEKLGL